MLRLHYRPHRAAAALLAAAACPLGAVRAQAVAYTGSVQFASGDYTFGRRTASMFLANGLTVSAGRLRASASVPLVFQDAGWVQYSGSGLVPTGGMPGHREGSTDRVGEGMPGMGRSGGMMDARGGMTSHVGLGDPVGRADIQLLTGGPGRPSLRAGVAVKAPLSGVSAGFGTGRWDVGAGASLAEEIGGSCIFADATYWVLGDTPALPLHDPIAYGVSVGRLVVDGRVGLLGSVTGYTRVLAGVAGPVQAGAGASYRFASDGCTITSSPSRTPATTAVGSASDRPGVTRRTRARPRPRRRPSGRRRGTAPWTAPSARSRPSTRRSTPSRGSRSPGPASWRSPSPGSPAGTLGWCGRRTWRWISSAGS